MNPGRAGGAARLTVRRVDVRVQRHIYAGPPRQRSLALSVIPAGGDTQHPGHGRDLTDRMGPRGPCGARCFRVWSLHRIPYVAFDTLALRRVNASPDLGSLSSRRAHSGHAAGSRRSIGLASSHGRCRPSSLPDAAPFGRATETLASFEARSAPLPNPTPPRRRFRGHVPIIRLHGDGASTDLARSGILGACC